MKFFPFISLCWTLLPGFILSADTVENRVWTSFRGVTLEAAFVRLDGGQVTLRQASGGEEIVVPLDALIEADQQFINKSYPGGRIPPKKARENYDDPWPKWCEVKGNVEIAIVKEDKENEIFIYHSPHYEFKCDVGLKKSLVGQFARMFEATFETMKELPMNFTKARNFDSSQRLKILLFEDYATYAENGGPPGSAGVYMGRSDTVLVPLTSLGVRPMGSSYIIDRDQDSGTLIHELVHQLTDRPIYSGGLRGWFTEGLAEYISNSPYRSGKIKFVGNIDDVMEPVIGFSKKYRRGFNLGETIRIQDLKKYMLQPYSSFTANSHFNYGVGTLLTTWLIHWDDDGSRRRLTALLKAAREGKRDEELIDVLLDGRSWEQMQEDITRAWRRKGVKFEFGKVSDY